MKKLITALTLTLFASCARQEGPLGIHVGDTLSHWATDYVVTSVGRDYVVYDGRRYTVQEVQSYIDNIDCPH
jgi:hypothetical protein